MLTLSFSGYLFLAVYILVCVAMAFQVPTWLAGSLTFFLRPLLFVAIYRDTFPLSKNPQ